MELSCPEIHLFAAFLINDLLHDFPSQLMIISELHETTNQCTTTVGVQLQGLAYLHQLLRGADVHDEQRIITATAASNIYSW